MDTKPTIPKKRQRESERLQGEIESLRLQLAEAQEALTAIQGGGVDALVIDTPEGQRIFTVQGAEHSYRALIEQMREGAVTLKADGTIDYCNQGFADMLGRPLEQIIGTSAHGCIAEVDQPAFAALLCQGLTGRVQGELAFLATQGRVVPAQVGLALLLDGRPGTSVSMVVTDLTERKRAEHVLAAKLIAEQATAVAEAASKAKDHFIAVLGHELRNPLNPVLTIASMLRDDLRLDADTREQLDAIWRNADLAARLIDDLLDVTRIRRGKVELDRQPLDLCTILRRAMNDCLPDIAVRKLEAGCDLGPGPYRIHGDAGRLQQVFWNLLKNAIKFTPEGGRVGIRCRIDGKGFVVAEVYDSGEGIDAEVLGRIFNAFDQGDRAITRQFGGLGLGLTVSKAIVEMHGGSIQAHSEGKGKGATLIVRLPLLLTGAAVLATPPSVAPPRNSPTGSLRILLVEDHADTARVMRRMLAADGHQVHLAADVATALRLAGEQTFDLLLSDLSLPDGSGLGLMRALRAKGLVLPGISMSGYGQEKDIRESREAGFTVHMVKPVNLPKLKREIARCFGMYPNGRQLSPEPSQPRGEQ